MGMPGGARMRRSARALAHLLASLIAIPTAVQQVISWNIETGQVSVVL